MGDFAFYDTWPIFRTPQVVVTMDCDFGGSDVLLGGDGFADYLVGGTSNDTIRADKSLSTNSSNLDVVFGDHGKILFYEDESHKLQQAITTEAQCNSGGDDTVTLGPGDDVVR